MAYRTFREAYRKRIVEVPGTSSAWHFAEARAHFADTLNRVSYRGERIVICRRGGKGVAVVVSMEDLALLRKIEDRLDH